MEIETSTKSKNWLCFDEFLICCCCCFYYYCCVFLIVPLSVSVFACVYMYLFISECLCTHLCIQLIVFITYVVLRKNQEDPVISSSDIASAPRESPLIYHPTRRYEAWRFLTYMLIHDGSA